MTNLDSVLQSRDIALPTEVHLVKAMVFPIVMYRCESWTIKTKQNKTKQQQQQQQQQPSCGYTGIQ